MSEEKKIEDLLKPRYRVIADYPMSKMYLNVGDILYWNAERNCYMAEANANGVSMAKGTVESYPHLFKLLARWEDRTIMELPDYIKWTSPGVENKVSFFKVNNWYSNPNDFNIAGCDVDAGRLFIKNCQPATEYEYTTYLNNNPK